MCLVTLKIVQIGLGLKDFNIILIRVELGLKDFNIVLIRVMLGLRVIDLKLKFTRYKHNSMIQTTRFIRMFGSNTIYNTRPFLESWLNKLFQPESTNLFSNTIGQNRIFKLNSAKI